MLAADGEHAQPIANLPLADLDAVASNWASKAVVGRGAAEKVVDDRDVG